MDFSDLFSEINYKKLVVSLVVGFVLAIVFVDLLSIVSISGPRLYLPLYWGTIVSAYLLYRLGTFKEIFGVALMVVGLVFISFPIIQELHSIDYASQIYSDLRARNATNEQIDAVSSMSIPSIFNFGVIVEDLAALIIGVALLGFGYYWQKTGSSPKKSK